MDADEIASKRRKIHLYKQVTSGVVPSSCNNPASTGRQEPVSHFHELTSRRCSEICPPTGGQLQPFASHAKASTQARHAKPARPAAAQAAVLQPPAGSVGAAQHNENSSAPLADLTVYLHGSIPLLQRRLKIITKRLQDLGAAVPHTSITASSSQSILAHLTHIVLHPSEADIATAAAAAAGPGATTAATAGSGSSSSTGAVQKPAGPATVLQVLQLVHKLQQQQKRQQQQLEGKPPPPPQQQQSSVKVVSDAWLDAVLQAGRYVPEEQYSLQHLLPGQSVLSSDSDSDGAVNNYKRSRQQGPRYMPELDPSPDAPMGKFALWLGRWEPAYNNITTQVELVLHGSYCRVASEARGQNEAIRNALKELEHYESAVAATSSRDIGGWGPGTIAHEALTYAHAAAVVRGCSFPLDPTLSPSRLQKLLPFVGAFTAKIIHQLLTTGSCEQLEAYRQDLPVANSQGQIRPNTAGGTTCALFVKLPGVGPTLADRWYSLGFRSFEALLQAAQDAGLLLEGSTAPATAAPAAAAVQLEGGPTALEPPAAAAAGEGEQPSSNLPLRLRSTQLAASLSNISPSQGLALPSRASRVVNPSGTDAVPFSREALYSLRYNADLLEAVPQEELQEMRDEVHRALAAVTGNSQGWKMQIVGGGRRDNAVHDADYLITNDDGSLVEGLVDKLYSQLVVAGRLVPEDEGFCRIQKGRMPGYKSKARADVLLGRFDHNHQMDHYDHIWGIFITQAGKRRRIDLMFIPPAFWTMAVIGWTGSKQYLRFMRHHAGNCGMNLNSHYLMRKVDLLPSVAAAAGSSRSAAETAQGPATQPPAAPAVSAAEEAPLGAANSSSAVTDGLAEAVSYATAAASSGASRVVLSVPDEAPPADRNGKDWWPNGWTSAPSASGTTTAATPAAGATNSPRVQLAALVAVGVGSDRGIHQERDLFDLLGIRYLEPGERNA